MSDEALLEEIRDRFTYGTNEWRSIRDEAEKDMRYIAGDCWEEEERRAREDAGRPCLSLDELGQYVNQAVNDVRQHKRGIKVTPQGSGAKDKDAELRQSLYRQVEYRSNAQTEAYITMFENTVQRSYGFLRVKPRYVSDRSFDQELIIEPLPNPDLVTPDPDFVRTDGSDWRWCFVAQSEGEKEFLRKHPDAAVRDFKRANQVARGWFAKPGRVQVAEYWRVTTTRRQLLKLKPPPPSAQDPQPQPIDVYVDELETLPTSEQILLSRWVDVPRVEQYLTNGLELLAKKGEPTVTTWKGKTIPIVPCFGKILYLKQGGRVVRVILSLIRLARDPAMLYCYYRTNQAELVGMTPKTPFVGYAGQFDGHEDNWSKVNQTPLAYLEVNPTIEGLNLQGAPLPLPQRQPYDPPIQSLELGAEAARRAIQAAMGISPLPTPAQRQNEKSGVALERIDSSAQKGSFHFNDHFNGSLQRTGALLDELAPHYYDTARDIAVRQPDDSPATVRINDQTAQEHRPIDPQHEFDITIATGPSEDSERTAAMDFADALAQSPVAPQVMDLIVKLRNLGPIGDAIADRLTPPQYRKQPQLESLPPDAQRMVMQAQAQIHDLTGKLQQAVEAIKTDQAKQQATIERAKVDGASRVQLAQLAMMQAVRLQAMRDAAMIAVAKINALTKGVVASNEAQDEALAEAQRQLHEVHQAEIGRAHDESMAMLDHAHALQQGEADTTNAATLADQGHQNALAQQAAMPPSAPDGSSGAPA